MKKTLSLFIILLCYNAFTYGFPYANSWSSEIEWRMGNIRASIMEYEEAARSRFLKELPPYREKWEAKYHDQIAKINSVIRHSMRYPDVYQNIFLFDQRIDIMKEFRYESAYELYMSPGWAYSKEEKKQKIEEKRAIVKEDALYCKDVLYECRDKITNAYLEIFEELLKKGEGNLAFYHDYGLLAYINNNFDKSFELLSSLIDNAQKTNQMEQLTAKVYHDLGSVCVEVMAYDKAIKYLSDSIRLNPSNKETYFTRATAYFETGQFDLAIDDYLISDKTMKVSRSKIPSKEFTKALCKSLCKGAAESAIDFVPSLCSTTYGIGKTLWASAKAPVESTKAFSSACYEMGKCFVDYCKTVDSNTIDGYIDHLKNLYGQFDHLSDTEKGEFIGHAIGKYGVEIFAGGFVIGGAIKGGKILVNGASAYRRLTNVNRACNLEAMAVSSANKEKIVAESLKHASQRETYFKNIRLNLAKHNKHVLGHHHFIPDRGIITVEAQEFESLVKQYAGKGQKIKGVFGEADYRERVDFGRLIGKFAVKVEGQQTQYLPTTKGIISYASDGTFHVWPSDPRAIIK
jgi:tetratricopeptide (TPR) repeat protein